MVKRNIRRRAISVRLVERAKDDDSPRRVSVVASTETPIPVWGADEVLSHKRGAVNLDRFKGAPVLVDHVNEVGAMAGRVVTAQIKNRQLVAEVDLLGSVGSMIEEKLESGVLRDVSVGYDIGRLEKTRDWTPDMPAEYTITEWTPHELSFVAVGADPNATVTGVRADYHRELEQEQRRLEETMPDEDKNPEGETPPLDETKIAAGVRAAVVKENGELYRFAEEYESKVPAGKIAAEVIKEGGGLSELKQRIFSALNDRLDKMIAKGGGDDPGLGMSRGEVDRFSFRKLFLAMANPNDNALREDAGHEYEVVHAEAKRVKAEGNETRSSMMIPMDVLRAPICGDRATAERVAAALRTRAVNVGTDSAGGFLVEEQLLASSYIDRLRETSAILPRATMLPNSVGNLDIPRLKTSVDPSWTEEAPGADTGLVQPVWDNVTMSPKRMYCGVPLTDTILRQSTPAAEGIVRMDILAQESLKVDHAAFVGDGTANDPKGILHQDDVNEITVASSTNGATLTRDVLIDMRTKIAQANGITGGETFFLNPIVGGKLRKTRVEEGAAGAGEGFLYDLRADRPVIGQMAVETTNIPADGTKGSGTELSPFFFGNPATVFVATWGGLDVQLDPFTMRRRGQVIVSVIRFADIAIRQPRQFSFVKDVVGNK